MYGRLVRAGEASPKEDREDLDERSRFQYLAVLQFLQAKGLLEAYVALEGECGVSYVEGALPDASVLEASLDMFADYRNISARSKSQAERDEMAAAFAAEEELQKLERGACCTGAAGEVVNPEPLGANVTAVCWVASKFDEFFSLAATADKRLRLLSSGGELLAETSDFASPLLGLDARPRASEADTFEVLVTSMGGEVVLLLLRRPRDGAGDWGFEVAQRFRDHAKHCSAARFAPAAAHGEGANERSDPVESMATGGDHFVTISRDHTARLYRRASPGAEFAPAGVVRLPGEVTALCWATPGTFVLAARDDHNLVYWDVSGGKDGGPKERMKANLNALGDSVVSFAVLALAVSSNGKMIAACTDRSRVILLQAFGARQLRNFYGAVVEEYDTPSVFFSVDGSFVYTTSSLPVKGLIEGEAEERLMSAAAQSMIGQVAVFEIKTGELVLQIPCHQRPVRCMHRHPYSEALVTGSFDKTVRFWS